MAGPEVDPAATVMERCDPSRGVQGPLLEELDLLPVGAATRARGRHRVGSETLTPDLDGAGTGARRG